MHQRFEEGQEIKSLCFADPELAGLETGYNCDRITVVMENGQMAGVPWFAIWSDEKIVTKVNAVHVEQVHFY